MKNFISILGRHFIGEEEYKDVKKKDFRSHLGARIRQARTNFSKMNKPEFSGLTEEKLREVVVLLVKAIEDNLPEKFPPKKEGKKEMKSRKRKLRNEESKNSDEK